MNYPPALLAVPYLWLSRLHSNLIKDQESEFRLEPPTITAYNANVRTGDNSLSIVYKRQESDRRNPSDLG